MGGTALDRTPGQNKVGTIAKIFGQKESFHLAMAPEGTRKKVEEIKTGFYYIAKSAEVPIIMMVFDFGKKRVKISDSLYPGNDKDKDFEKIKNFYREATGKVVHYT